MPVNRFLADPTGRVRDNNHDAYNNSIFASVAPEYSTGEVLVGSAYRKLILGIGERTPDLEKIPSLPQDIATQATHPSEEPLWETLVMQQGGIASPMRGKAKLAQLMPLVPSIARHACVLGKVRDRWNPANLLLQVIGAGRGPSAGTTLVRRLGEALCVSDDDDIFARFIARRFDTLDPAHTNRPFSSLTLGNAGETRGFRGYTALAPPWSPAERFCKDLEAVLNLKDGLTRRQWTVLIEALLRLGLGMHVLWVCHVNITCWRIALSVAAGSQIPTADDIENVVWKSHRDTHALLEVGRDARPVIKQMIEQYVYARFGLNLLLHRLEDIGQPWSGTGNQVIGYSPGSTLTAPGAICSFFTHVATHRAGIHPTDPAGGPSWLRSKCAELLDENPSLFALARCRSGFTSNLTEFAWYSLGQIDTLDPDRIAYDQSYLLANKRNRRERFLPVQPGPAMLILLVHACCQSQAGIPASLEDFRLHLSDYGLRVPAGELMNGQVGADLQKVGLVVDSPDASGGRLLVDPF